MTATDPLWTPSIETMLRHAPVESPMEAALLRGLLSLGDLGPPEAGAICAIDKWMLRAQQPVDHFRLDFTLSHRFGLVAIECDGHQFHERTPEQATRDRRRDRYLTIRGWRVLRFTGTEIKRDLRWCMSDVIRMMRHVEERGI